jgi:hypothetical protein
MLRRIPGAPLKRPAPCSGFASRGCMHFKKAQICMGMHLALLHAWRETKHGRYLGGGGIGYY